MTVTYSTKMASRFGINTALVAAYLYQEMKTKGKVAHERRWVRCSRKTLTAVYPFLGEKAVANALKKLTLYIRAAGIALVTVKCFQDHISIRRQDWYFVK